MSRRLPGQTRRAGAITTTLAAVTILGASTILSACGGGPRTGTLEEAGVRVTASVSDESALVTFTPTEPATHVYAVDFDPASTDWLGVPTKVTVLGDLTATGAPSADQPVIQLRVGDSSQTLPVYPDGPVTITIPVKSTGDRPRLQVSYASCSATGCNLPVTNAEVRLG